ncbi:MAG: hypothetical protein NTV06_07520, partial [candidate division Zixibacteria bacterium]|nr:hypothetical protein [candidate division Zixibacteria bacterium]
MGYRVKRCRDSQRLTSFTIRNLTYLHYQISKESFGSCGRAEPQTKSCGSATCVWIPARNVRNDKKRAAMADSDIARDIHIVFPHNMHFINKPHRVGLSISTDMPGIKS